MACIRLQSPISELYYMATANPFSCNLHYDGAHFYINRGSGKHLPNDKQWPHHLFLKNLSYYHGAESSLKCWTNLAWKALILQLDIFAYLLCSMPSCFLKQFSDLLVWEFCKDQYLPCIFLLQGFIALGTVSWLRQYSFLQHLGQLFLYCYTCLCNMKNAPECLLLNGKLDHSTHFTIEASIIVNNDGSNVASYSVFKFFIFEALHLKWILCSHSTEMFWAIRKYLCCSLLPFPDVDIFSYINWGIFLVFYPYILYFLLIHQSFLFQNC